MENAEDLKMYYKKLIESIKLLSLGYDDQKSMMPSFVDVPFEVLDTFDYAFGLLPSLLEHTFFSNEQATAIFQIKDYIDKTADSPELSNLEEEQFRNHKAWEDLRIKAKELLEILNVQNEKPDPDFI